MPLTTRITLSRAVLTACLCLAQAGPVFSSAAASISCDDCNIILISINVLRPDHLGCYGYDRGTSPNLDRIASEGTLFEDFIAQSNYSLQEKRGRDGQSAPYSSSGRLVKASSFSATKSSGII